MKNSGEKIQFYFSILIGTIFLMIPAFYNGYPIVNPDDNTYVLSGFLPDTPFDRPITYGLILRLITLNGISLYIAAFLQCWLVSWLLLKTFRNIIKSDHVNLIFLLTMFILSLTTSLAWISSEMIPDVYTSIALLSLILILLRKENARTEIVLFSVFTISVATHMSNVMIFFIVLMFLLTIRKKISLPGQEKGTTKRICIALFLALATISIMGSAISKSKHVFGVAALLEQGILKTYLDDKCPTEHYQICKYKDALPKDANVFLWDQNSPVYKTGGWHANKDEYTEIISESFTTPKYLFLRMKMSSLFSAKQLMTFGVGDGNFSIDTPFFNTVKMYIPNDTRLFENSKQHRSTLLTKIADYNLLLYVIVAASVLYLIISLSIQTSKKTSNFKLFMLVTVLTAAVNIWDCATFAQVNGRYGCRVMWLLPLCAIFIGIEDYNNFRSRHSKNN